MSKSWGRHEHSSHPWRPKRPCPLKGLENIVILCFERRFSKQNCLIRLKSNILPPKFLGCLRHWSHLKLGPYIAEDLPSFSLWTPKSMWRWGSYYQIHKTRIQDWVSTCSIGFPKTSSNISAYVVCNSDGVTRVTIFGVSTRVRLRKMVTWLASHIHRMSRLESQSMILVRVVFKKSQSLGLANVTARWLLHAARLE